MQLASCIVYYCACVATFQLLRPAPSERTHRLRDAFESLGFSLLGLYFFALVFLVLQDATTVRSSMLALDDSLNQTLPELPYGSDCRIYTPENKNSSFANVKLVVWDIFILPHTFGWVCGQLLLRDWRVSWIISVAFEVYELSFMHWLPNFNECWWDHVFVDVLICNAVGIYTGSMIMRRLKLEEYNWLGIEASLASCHYITSLKRFLQVSVMMLNAFFLKTVLWVPHDHWANVARLLLWYYTGPFGMAEYYTRIGGAAEAKLGYRDVFCAAVIFVEAAVWTKTGLADFKEPFPPTVVLFWKGLLAAALIHTGRLMWPNNGQ